MLPPQTLINNADKWDRTWSMRYVKIDDVLKTRLSAVMTRTQPWKVLYPHLREY